MEDVITLEEADDAGSAAYRRRRASRAASAANRLAKRSACAGRLAEVVQRAGAGTWSAVSGVQRLAALYFAQTGLIFPGRRTQGSAPAHVQPPPCGEVVTLRTTAARRRRAVRPRDRRPTARSCPTPRTRPTLLFFYGNGHHLADRQRRAPVRRRCARIGVNVMVPEYVGYGLSSGDAVRGRLLRHRRRRLRATCGRGPDVDPSKIVAVGASLGGAVAIDLASREPRRRRADHADHVHEHARHGEGRAAQRCRSGGSSATSSRASRRCRACTCPALIIHSTGDAPGPLRHGRPPRRRLRRAGVTREDRRRGPQQRRDARRRGQPDLRRDDGVPHARLTMCEARDTHPFAQAALRRTATMPRAMSDPLGSLCIVLHGHLPYVLHHGTYPHGEAWLYEAAAETYLPLLDMIGEVALDKAPAGADDRPHAGAARAARARAVQGGLRRVPQRARRPRRAQDRQGVRGRRTSAHFALPRRAVGGVVRGEAGALRADRPRHPGASSPRSSARGTSRS